MADDRPELENRSHCTQKYGEHPIAEDLFHCSCYSPEYHGHQESIGSERPATLPGIISMSDEGFLHGFEIDANHSLHIYQGSLVQVQSDALVSSDDNYLTAGGGVSLALAQAAGQDVREECQRLVRTRRPALGDVVRTSAGALPCRYLYHAITLDFDRRTGIGPDTLRLLVAKLLKQAMADGAQSLGMPAIGTGAAFFDLGSAAEIMIEELLARLVETPIKRVILALPGDRAQRLFYKQLVRANADRCAVKALRQHEAEPLPSPMDSQPRPVTAAVGETIEQFPNLVDEVRLASTARDRPRLVEGLADLILRHAPQEEIEQELLRNYLRTGSRSRGGLV